MNAMNLKLDRLKSFVLVAEESNLTRAAQRRHSTPSAVSEHLKQLESALSVRLFERNSQGMVLTREGELLLVPARKALGGVEEMADLARQLGQHQSVSVTVGINAPPEHLRVDRLIQLCARTLPSVSLELRTISSNVIVDKVASGELDAGFVYGQWPNENLEFRYLTDVAVSVIGPAKTPLAALPSEPGEVMALPWVWPTQCCPFYGMLQQLMGPDWQRSRRVATSEDEYTALAMVSAGLGYGLVEHSLAADWASRNKVVEFAEPELSTTLSFCSHRHPRRHGAIVRELVALVADQLFAEVRLDQKVMAAPTE